MQLAIIAAVAAVLTQVSEVNPCALVRCAAGTTCHVTEEGTAACLKDCETTCGTAVPHGWSGYDDGSNACNKCGCSNGAMVCTKIGCPEAPCPGDVCAKATTCGGITGASCNSKSHVCIDDPADDCDPAAGGADCIGCCVFNQCALTLCGSGYVCELNSAGQATCVDPCSKVDCKEGYVCQSDRFGPECVLQNPCAAVKCAAGTTCGVTAEGIAACLKDCETTCGTAVPHGWSGFDDGSNACNRCGCSDGAMICTRRACPDAPCPGDVCTNATTCGGITGASCSSKSHVCIDDPADDCDPAEGGADCIGCCVQKPACCLAVPTCSAGYTQVDTCTDDQFAKGVCVSVTLCCTTIACAASTIR